MSVISSFRVSLKLAAAASACILSVAVILKHYSAVPFIASSDIASCWNSIIMSQWLKPPYLYLLINAIIISIVASSKLQQNDNNHDPSSSFLETSIPPMDEKLIVHAINNDDEDDDKKVTGEMIMDGDDDEVEKPPTPQKENKDKPPVSARFGHRRVVKSSPEGGKALRVTKSKRDETLESAWMTITEGRGMPLTRHLKKSDTWDSHVRPQAPKVKKAETFPECSAVSNSRGRLRREPSPSQDELNRRVEAFIKKFNEEMRLQRQRSLEQYNQMIINPVAH